MEPTLRLVIAFSVGLLAASWYGHQPGRAQGPGVHAHNTGWNSSFKLTNAQIKAAKLDHAAVDNVEKMMNFERTQMAFGGPEHDDFYTLPSFTEDTYPTKPGQLLKVQAVTDITAYALPPNVALSRIIYTTTTFNGTIVPASGFVLWPYVPRQVANRGTKAASAVIWLHGTSSFYSPHAPSAHRSLWYDYRSVFTLAQAGYAVFAPDYAGLGVQNSWDGSKIPHQYMAHPATAHEALYGFRAALEAFPEHLDNNFVIMGHSQGGSAAWASAEVLAREEADFQDLLPGYKGTIPASPNINPLVGPRTWMFPHVAQMLSSIFPSFRLEDWLTPLGVSRVELAREIGAGNILSQELCMSLPEEKLIRTDHNKSWHIKAFGDLAQVGRKNFKGPVLVLQGTEDLYVPYPITQETVKDTWKLVPERDLEILVAHGVGHTPVLSATMHIWLQWVANRLNGRPLEKKGSARTDVHPLRPAADYAAVANSFPLWAGMPEHKYQATLDI